MGNWNSGQRERSRAPPVHTQAQISVYPKIPHFFRLRRAVYDSRFSVYPPQIPHFFACGELFMIVDSQYTKHQRYIYFSIPSNRFSLLTQKIMNELNLERPYTIWVYWNPRNSWCMKLKPIVGYTEIDSWTPRFLAWYTENSLVPWYIEITALLTTRKT